MKHKTKIDNLELTVTITEEYLDGYHIESGGDNRNSSWNEYVDYYHDHFHVKLKLIKQALTEMDLIGTTADKICNNIYFDFSDDTNITYTWRAWGDLMQAIINKKEGYMKYYM